MPVRRLILECAAATALFCLYHRLLVAWMARTGGHLGAVHAGRVPPLHARWETDWPAASAVAMALLTIGVFLFVFRRLFREASIPPRRLLPLGMGFFVAIGLSISMIDGWQCRAGECLPAWLAPYSRTHLEYLGDVPKVDEQGPRRFLQRYTRPHFFDRLALHSKTHPPGATLLLWLVGRLLGPGPVIAALFTIGFSALTVPLLYALGREISDEITARTATGLFLLAPNFVMYATTSMDGPFSVLPLLGIVLFVRALRTGRLVPSALGGVAFAASTLLSYAAVFAGVFCGLYAMMVREARPGARLRLLATALGSFLAAHLLVILVTGFDLPAAIRASMSHDRTLMGASRFEGLLQYANVSVANLAAFSFSVGVPVAVLWIHQARTAASRRHQRRAQDALALATLLTVLAMSFSTLFTLEVERVWLFMTPLVVLAATLALSGREEDGSKAHPALAFALGLTALQLVLSEIVLRTDW